MMPAKLKALLLLLIVGLFLLGCGEEPADEVVSGEDISIDDYGRMEDISIDYAIMEKTTRGVVLPSDFGWSDIGSWKALYDFLPKDAEQNVIDSTD